jgi:glycosidase
MAGQKPDEEIRLPMQWTMDAANAGFTTGTPWRAPGANTTSMNVNIEDNVSTSLLNHYRALINLRNQHPALLTGSLVVFRASSPAVYAILRSQGGEIILVLVNLSGEKLKDFNLGATGIQLKDGSYQAETIFGTGTARPMTISAGSLSAYKPLDELPPYSTTIFVLH